MSNIVKSENSANESPATADELNASPQPEGEENASKSRLNSIRDYLFKNKTGTDPTDSKKPTPVAASDKPQKRTGRYPRPPIDLELKYPLIDIKEMDPSTIETYNERVQEMSKRLSGPLRAAGRVGTGTFTRELAEEIVGTDLRTRRHFDKIYRELLEETRRAFIEERERPQEGRWGTLESRPSFISQRINEEEEIQTGEYGPGDKKRGKQRVE